MKNEMHADFLSLTGIEQFEILDALVAANHQFQENERKFESQLSVAMKAVEAAYREGHANGHRSGTDDAGWSSPTGRHVDDDWKDSDALAKLKESE